MNRFKVILATQWKWSWGVVLLATIAAFAIPILSVQNAVVDQSTRSGADAPQHFLRVMERFSPWYTVIAAAIGLGLAMLAWSADHRGRHVYALTLPVERWRLVLLRYASGLTLLTVPAIALLIGATLAVTNTVIPDGLHAYQVALTFRFFLASAVAFSLFFAISSGTARTAGVILAPIAFLIVLDLLLSAFGIREMITDGLMQALLTSPGVLEVFTGRWLLVDV